MTPSDVLDDVFVEQHLVSHLSERRVTHVDLSLAGSADFVVVNLDDDAGFFQRPHHLRTKVVLMIHGRHDLRSEMRSEEHTSELQSRGHLVCRLLLEKKKKKKIYDHL